MNLQPTMSLRWIERELDDEGPLTHYPVLQQWWTDSYGGGEWRDIPSGVE